jgi:hypothetical protein
LKFPGRSTDVALSLVLFSIHAQRWARFSLRPPALVRSIDATSVERLGGRRVLPVAAALTPRPGERADNPRLFRRGTGASRDPVAGRLPGAASAGMSLPAKTTRTEVMVDMVGMIEPALNQEIARLSAKRERWLMRSQKRH